MENECEGADDVMAELEAECGRSAHGGDSGGSRTANRAGSGRLTVLESSVALIEQLTTACRHMEAACNAKDAQLSRLSSHLHSVAGSIAQQTVAVSAADSTASSFGNLITDSYAYPDSSSSSSVSDPPSYPSLILSSSSDPRFPSSVLSALPPSTASYLAHLDRSHSLRRGGLDFLPSSLCVVVIATPGIILHVNDRFLDCSGWRRSELVMTSFEKEDAATHPLCPMALAKPPAIQHHNGSSDRLSRYMPQYPASIDAVEAMKRGERRKADCRWRCRLGDGSGVVECDSTFWAVYDKTPPLAGQEQRSPDRMVSVFELDDAVLVEPADWEEDKHAVS